MNTRRTRLIAAATLLVAITGLSLAVAALAGGTPDPAANPITPEEALATDAGYYAADVGVSQAEAVRRILIQDELWSITRRVADELPQRHAGTWMYHEGGFGCVVWFTGEPDPEAEARMAAIVAEAPAPVEVRWGAKFPLEFLRAAQQEYSRELWNYEGASGLGIDVKNNAISFDLARDSKWDADPGEFGAMLEKRFGVPFSVTLVEGPMRDQPYWGP